ncbi:MAG: mechanosensitive ion channel family protein [Thermoplasmatales archaeon]|nr:mechanosensitive ion channel family protein [Thermoplasmatales archaeon]
MSGLGMVTGFNLVLLDVGIIVALTALFAWIVNLILRGVMRASNPQVAVAMRRLGVAVVVAVGAVLAVQELGVSPSILLLVIGLVAVAAIVAIRVPLENAGARFFSGIYSPFKVGDTIRVAGQTGRVIEINAMTTILLSEDDRMVALPNSTRRGRSWWSPSRSRAQRTWRLLRAGCSRASPSSASASILAFLPFSP